MELKDITISFDLAKRLKELGVKPKGKVLFYYLNEEIIMFNQHSYDLSESIVPSYTTDELLEMLPKNITEEGENITYRPRLERSYHGYEAYYGTYSSDDQLCTSKYHKTPCDALANLLIYLLENKLIPFQL